MEYGIFVSGRFLQISNREPSLRDGKVYPKVSMVLSTNDEPFSISIDPTLISSFDAFKPLDEIVLQCAFNTQYQKLGRVRLVQRPIGNAAQPAVAVLKPGEAKPS
jgi:hypothetical protein